MVQLSSRPAGGGGSQQRKPHRRELPCPLAPCNSLMGVHSTLPMLMAKGTSLSFSTAFGSAWTRASRAAQ